jgi:hypothetical protein
MIIFYSRECFDCADFARRIRSAFPKDANIGLSDGSRDNSGTKYELLIGVRDVTKPPPLAMKLSATLSKAHLANEFVPGIYFPSGPPEIRPPSPEVQLFVLPRGD